MCAVDASAVCGVLAYFGIVYKRHAVNSFFIFLPFGLVFWCVFWLTLGMNKLSTANQWNDTMNEYTLHLNVTFLNVRATSEDDAIEAAYRLLETLKVHLANGTQMDIDFHAIEQTN